MVAWPGEFWGALRQALRMDPLRSMTDPRPVQSVRMTRSASPAAPDGCGLPSDPNMAQVAAGTATAPRMATTTDHHGGTPTRLRGRMGIFVALGLGTVAAIGGAVFLLGRKTPDAGSKATPVVASVTASATASAPVPVAPVGCPDKMISIPGGSFFMGSDDGLALEKPAHQVSLKPFCIDEFEARTDDYTACSDGGRCKRAGTTNEWEGIADKDRKAFDPLGNVRNPEAKASHPINSADWEMADTVLPGGGRRKRLPTEAEWEFAARGPDGRKYPWGDDPPGPGWLNACGKECVAWGLKNGVEEKQMYDADDGFATTSPVGSFPKGASRYGVKDVVGNVWEWVADYYGPYASEEQKEPRGPEAGTERVIRGGAWNGSFASWVRPTFRYKDSPAMRRLRHRLPLREVKAVPRGRPTVATKDANLPEERGSRDSSRVDRHPTHSSGGRGGLVARWRPLGTPVARHFARATVTTTDLLAGVLLLRATDPRGTSTFASGKYVAQQPRGIA